MTFYIYKGTERYGLGQVGTVTDNVLSVDGHPIYVFDELQRYSRLLRILYIFDFNIA